MVFISEKLLFFFFFGILLEKALLSVRCSYIEKPRLKRTMGVRLVETPHRAGSALNPHQVSQGLVSQVLETSSDEDLLSFGAAQGYPHSNEVFPYTRLGAFLFPWTSTVCPICVLLDQTSSQSLIRLQYLGDRQSILYLHIFVLSTGRSL